MRRLIESCHRILALFRRRQLERDFDDELQFHLEMKAQDSEHAGALAAARDARRHFGRPLAAKDGMRDAWTFTWLDDLMQDLKYAVRTLRRSPGYSLAASITLALGIGLSTAIVSIVNTILISSLPYKDSDRLVQIAENVTHDAPDGMRFTRRFGLTQAEFLEWRTRTTTLSQMAGVINLMNGAVLTSEGSVSAPRAIVSPALFDILGVRAQIGRTLLAD